MVRIKERYLLVNILYPTELGSKRGVSDLVVLNSPTTEQLTPGALIRALRAEIAINFGDYGSGAIEGGGLSSASRESSFRCLNVLPMPDS